MRCASRCAAGPSARARSGTVRRRPRAVREAGLRGRRTLGIAGRRGSTSPVGLLQAAAAAQRAPAALHIQTVVRGRGGGTVTASRRAATPSGRRANQRAPLPRRATRRANPCLPSHVETAANNRALPIRLRCAPRAAVPVRRRLRCCAGARPGGRLLVSIRNRP